MSEKVFSGSEDESPTKGSLSSYSPHFSKQGQRKFQSKSRKSTSNTTTSSNSSPLKDHPYPTFDLKIFNDNFQEFIEAFDKSFYQIVPSKTRYNHFQRSPSVEISPNALNPSQLQGILKIHGLLISLKDFLEISLSNEFHQSFPFACNAIPTLPNREEDLFFRFQQQQQQPLSQQDSTSSISQTTKNSTTNNNNGLTSSSTSTSTSSSLNLGKMNTKLHQQITILQSYLVNELNHSEELEKQVKDLQNQLNELQNNAKSNNSNNKTPNTNRNRTTNNNNSNTNTNMNNRVNNNSSTSSSSSANIQEEMKNEILRQRLNNTRSPQTRSLSKFVSSKEEYLEESQKSLLETSQESEDVIIEASMENPQEELSKENAKKKRKAEDKDEEEELLKEKNSDNSLTAMKTPQTPPKVLLLNNQPTISSYTSVTSQFFMDTFQKEESDSFDSSPQEGNAILHSLKNESLFNSSNKMTGSEKDADVSAAGMPGDLNRENLLKHFQTFKQRNRNSILCWYSICNHCGLQFTGTATLKLSFHLSKCPVLNPNNDEEQQIKPLNVGIEKQTNNSMKLASNLTSLLDKEKFDSLTKGKERNFLKVDHSRVTRSTSSNNIIELEKHAEFEEGEDEDKEEEARATVRISSDLSREDLLKHFQTFKTKTRQKNPCWYSICNHCGHQISSTASLNLSTHLRNCQVYHPNLDHEQESSTSSNKMAESEKDAEESEVSGDEETGMTKISGDLNSREELLQHFQKVKEISRLKNRGIYCICNHCGRQLSGSATKRLAMHLRNCPELHPSNDHDTATLYSIKKELSTSSNKIAESELSVEESEEEGRGRMSDDRADLMKHFLPIKQMTSRNTFRDYCTCNHCGQQITSSASKRLEAHLLNCPVFNPNKHSIQRSDGRLVGIKKESSKKRTPGRNKKKRPRRPHIDPETAKQYIGKFIRREFKLGWFTAVIVRTRKEFFLVCLFLRFLFLF